jgi:myosin-5
MVVDNISERIDVNDMATLTKLDEKTMLKVLTTRFALDKIYTWTGRILLAVNPYQNVDIYDLERTLEIITPHVYSIAESAIRDIYAKDLSNVSILISGESGAGKTESAKYIMRYISHHCRGLNSIEDKVLASNPILEAFGNAATTRNNNSSRFGKYIDIQLDGHRNILGAAIRTFLLEKVRVVSIAPGERNFHIWYQVLASKNIKKTFKFLKNTAWASNDKQNFEETKAALVAFGINAEDVSSLLLGILYLGNVEFDEDGLIVSTTEDLEQVANYWDITLDTLNTLLTYRKIMAGKEVINVKMKQLECFQRRDSLAKSLYSTLFDWVVAKINEELVPTEAHSKSIGILDIFGFENFATNGFEQLCINYTNEILQQVFQNFVFEQEQQEYIEEGIDWADIEFPNNDEVIATIEDKIYPALDEECSLTKPSHRHLISKLSQVNNDYLSSSKMQTAKGRFEVKHYAGKVEYGSDVSDGGLLAKNIDLRHPEQNAFVENSTHPILTQFEYETHRKVKTASVGKQFKANIKKLQDLIFNTKPYFVRCLKPNQDAKPKEFDNELITQQLRYCGILEATKISRAGFPARFEHALFESRYGNLLGNQYLQHASSIRKGKTKYYMKQGVYERLESAVLLRKKHSSRKIQRNFRSWNLSRKTKAVRKIIRFIQSARVVHFVKNIAKKARSTKRLIAIQEKLRLKKSLHQWNLFVHNQKEAETIAKSVLSDICNQVVISCETDAEEQARVAAEEARIAAEEQARVAAEEARIAAEEQARVAAEEARIAAEEQARVAAEEARIAAEQARVAAEEQARVAAEEARIAAEEQARVAAEEARIAAEEQARVAAEEARIAAEEQARVAAEEARIAAMKDANAKVDKANCAAQAAIDVANERIMEALRNAEMRIQEVEQLAAERVEAANKSANERVEAADKSANERVEAADKSANERVEAADKSANERVEAADKSANERVEAADKSANERILWEKKQAEERILAERAALMQEGYHNNGAAGDNVAVEKTRDLMMEEPGEYVEVVKHDEVNRLIAAIKMVEEQRAEEMDRLISSVKEMEENTLSEINRLIDAVCDGEQVQKQRSVQIREYNQTYAALTSAQAELLESQKKLLAEKLLLKEVVERIATTNIDKPNGRVWKRSAIVFGIINVLLFTVIVGKGLFRKKG